MMGDLQLIITMVFYMIMFVLMIRFWNEIAERIGEMLGIKKLVEWFLKKFKI